MNLAARKVKINKLKLLIVEKAETLKKLEAEYDSELMKAVVKKGVNLEALLEDKTQPGTGAKSQNQKPEVSNE